MMKVYKAVHERENKCKELHKEMNMNVGPTRLVQPDFYLLVDVDDLQKQVNTLENEVHRMKRAEARRKRCMPGCQWIILKSLIFQKESKAGILNLWRYRYDKS